MEMIEQLFTKVKPDLITMDILGWMSAMQMKKAMDISLFDSEYSNLVEDMAQAGIVNRGNSFSARCIPAENKKQIFQHEARLKLYRFFIEEIRRVSEETPIAICMETEEMWEELSDELGMRKDNYVCCCGPKSVPGHPLLLN